tara:strand:+ start:137 stop:1357 length:1221 start_codon:yes stop_codon:yes gene_type:complete
MFLKNKKDVIVLLSIFSIAMVMRGPITGISPLLIELKRIFNLSSHQIGILTSIPLFALSVFSLVSAFLASKKGVLVAMFTGVILIAVGIVFKVTGKVELLFIGTLAVGAGVAMANVMLPSIVKMYFPQQTAIVTSLYILFFSVGGAVCSIVALPIMNIFNDLSLPGWKYAVGSTLILVIIPTLLWLPRLKSSSQDLKKSHHNIDVTSVLYSGVAWCLTLFFGLTAFMNYAFITWLPKILLYVGLSKTNSGFQHGLLQVAGAIPSLILVPLLAKNYSIIKICFMSIGCVILSILGFIYYSELYCVWVVLVGCGTSSVFILSLTLFNNKSSTVEEVFVLSSMVQFIGYILASLGLNGLSTLINLQHGEERFLFLLLSICPLWLLLSFYVTKPSMIEFKYKHNTINRRA